ncbi:MAG: SurA N-terminal domain-containing protein, partial [Fimbriimonadales bacterium]|nr:SurA N-terminal domain-containing protein [Fimbriimonadales bacterium]
MNYRYGVLSVIAIALAVSPVGGAPQQSQNQKQSQPKQQTHDHQRSPTAQGQKQQLKQQSPSMQVQKQQPKQQTPRAQGQKQQPKQQPQKRQPQRSPTQSQMQTLPLAYRPAPLPAGDTVVATVNGEPIRASELLQYTYDWFAASAVEDLILVRLIEQEARKEGVSVPEADIE